MFKELFTRPPVVVQGITGRHGAFHTAAMLAAGTNVVAGVTPGKGGQAVQGVPVYGSMAEAVRHHPAAISVVFVPAPHAKAAMLDALTAGITMVVCITEGLPVHDMLAVRAEATRRQAMIIGPNCPGLLLPGHIKLGIIPQIVGSEGQVAIVSRSGTLTYEVAAALTAAGIGQRYIVGIGGDMIVGTTFVDCLRAFDEDPEVDRIVLIGEIGGQAEHAAAAYVAQKRSSAKPVYAYVVGHSAPTATQLGHAGAIMGAANEGAAAKTTALAQAGCYTATSIPELVTLLARRA